MPLYEYRCSRCSYTADELLKADAQQVMTCPSCGTETYVKQLASPAFSLKGTGWYATDFKGKPDASI